MIGATVEDICFLRGPCRDVISKGQGQNLVENQSVKRRLGSRCERAASLEVSQLEHREL
jgi:hypothetical protein